MEESMKKVVMLVVIVVCLVLAGVIFLRTSRTVERDLERFEGMKTWVKCRNPDCRAEYEMSLKEYYKFKDENQDPSTLVAPPLTCEKCGEPSVYKAIKCPKCGFIFEEGSLPRGTYSDTCPKCYYSQAKENRRRAAEARREGG
jgi:hypothetical protein